MLIYDTMSAMGKTCSFFGHRSIIDDVSVKQQLYEVVEELIVNQDVDTFLLGEMGDFEIIAGKVLNELKRSYPFIQRIEILCFAEQLNRKSKIQSDGFDYLDELDLYKRRARIIKRNQWVIDNSDILVFFVHSPYGGAYQSYLYAKKKKKDIINLTQLE